MEMADLRRLLRGYFDIHVEVVAGEPDYKVRFIGPPYDSFVPGCKSIKVTAHQQGNMMCPLHITRVFGFFDITEAQFREAFNLFVQEIPPQAGIAAN